MFDSKFHGHQSTKLQLSYKMMFGYVKELQIAHLIPLNTVNVVSYNKFSKLWPGRARPVFRPNQYEDMNITAIMAVTFFQANTC